MSDLFLAAAGTSGTSPCAAHGCSYCCHDTMMPLTPGDVSRLQAAGHDVDAFSFDDEGVRRLRTRDEEAPDGRPCFFLGSDGACSVYEVRPEGCRIYPFVVDEDARLTRDEDCPYRAEFAAPPHARRVVLDILRRSGEWPEPT